MSHTSFLPEGWIAIHDGDYRGDVLLRKIQENADQSKSIVKEIEVPSSVLFSYVAGAVRHQKVVKVEEATDSEILGLK